MNVLPFCFSGWQLNITFFPVTLLLLALMPSTCLGNFSSFCPLYRDPSSSSKHALKAYEIGCGCFAFGIHPEASPVFSFSYTNLSCHLSLAASLGPSPDLFLTVTVSSDFPRRIHIACLEGHSLCLLSLCPSSLTLTNASISLPKSTLSPSGKRTSVFQLNQSQLFLPSGGKMWYSGTLCNIMNPVTFQGIGNAG